MVGLVSVSPLGRIVALLSDVAAPVVTGLTCNRKKQSINESILIV